MFLRVKGLGFQVRGPMFVDWFKVWGLGHGGFKAFSLASGFRGFAR